MTGRQPSAPGIKPLRLGRATTRLCSGTASRRASPEAQKLTMTATTVPDHQYDGGLTVTIIFWEFRTVPPLQNPNHNSARLPVCSHGVRSISTS